MTQWNASSERWTSLHRLIDLHWGSAGAPFSLLAQRIDFRNALNTDFTFTVHCLVPGTERDISALPGRVVGVGVATAGGGRRWLNGIIHAVRRTGMHAGHTRMVLQIGSALALLEQRRAWLPPSTAHSTCCGRIRCGPSACSSTRATGRSSTGCWPRKASAIASGSTSQTASRATYCA